MSCLLKLLHYRSNFTEKPHAVISVVLGLKLWEGLDLRLQCVTALAPCYGMNRGHVALQSLGTRNVRFHFLLEYELFQVVGLRIDGEWFLNDRCRRCRAEEGTEVCRFQFLLAVCMQRLHGLGELDRVASLFVTLKNMTIHAFSVTLEVPSTMSGST